MTIDFIHPATKSCFILWSESERVRTGSLFRNRLNFIKVAILREMRELGLGEAVCQPKAKGKDESLPLAHHPALDIAAATLVVLRACRVVF